MRILRKLLFYMAIGLINNILNGTHFFKLKRKMLNLIGIKVGEGSCVVGPIECGSMIEITIGMNCWIGKDIAFDGDGKVCIGNNVDIAPHCVLCTGGHVIGDHNHRAGNGEHYTITIEDGCWIGTRVTVVNSTRVGAGTVVAAGATVIEDTGSNNLVAGCPARIKKKFEEENESKYNHSCI